MFDVSYNLPLAKGLQTSNWIAVESDIQQSFRFGEENLYSF